jgi:hypothetical protein
MQIGQIIQQCMFETFAWQQPADRGRWVDDLDHRHDRQHWPAGPDR